MITYAPWISLIILGFTIILIDLGKIDAKSEKANDVADILHSFVFSTMFYIFLRILPPELKPISIACSIFLFTAGIGLMLNYHITYNEISFPIPRSWKR